MSLKNRNSNAARPLPRAPFPQGFVITIDGPAGSGKSTTAKELARRLRLMYLDTGSTYRALAYAALQRGWHPIADAKRLTRLARRIPLRFKPGRTGHLHLFLDGQDVTRVIRTEEVTEAAAYLAQNPDVRSALVKRQRNLAPADGVVVEGRDTGTVVFPDATHKFFLTANLGVRAKRRQRDLFQLYGSHSPLEQLCAQLHFRDQLDRTRHVGPLVKPKGAIMIDTSRLSVHQTVEIILRHITQGRSARSRLRKKPRSAQG